jgi:hypothetical protein
MNYLEAYRARLERNEAALKNLIFDVKKLRPEIKAHVNLNGGLLKSVTFIRGEDINTACFHEVPYCWSGCGYSKYNPHYGGENGAMPFSAEDVINNFVPVTTKNHTYDTKFKSMEQYLKWCSYLTEYSETVMFLHQKTHT